MIAVVIVNFNAGAMLADAVASVIDGAGRVVVVDNASTDASVDALERRFGGRPTLAVVRRSANGGFSVGCNDGLRALGWIGAAVQPGAPDDAVLFLASPSAGYITAQTGWFSDRSALYLSLGRPVLLQETGWSKWLPEGKGLVAFRNLEEAAERVREIESNYARHAQAAEAVARDHLASEKAIGDALQYL